MKRKLQQVQVARKLRSTLPLRRRAEVPPIIFSGEKNTYADSTSAASTEEREEVSCVSSRVSFTKSPAKSTDSNRRIITRLYSRKREKQKREKAVVSESSCVDSCSNLTVERNELSTAEFSRKNAKSAPIGANSESSCVNSSSNLTIDRNEISCVNVPAKIVKSAAIVVRESEIPAESESSCVNSCLNPTIDRNEVSCADFPAKIDESAAIVVREREIPGETELDCSLLCDEVESDYSSAFSDIGSDIFGVSSSDYTPSMWLESGSEFSERSVGESSPSPAFSLFIQYSHQFCKSAFCPSPKSASEVENKYIDVPMEDEEDELSYTILRSRERREVYMQDYAEEYCSTTAYGHLVIQQRLQMVHWIVEQSTSRELHKETMFLGVSLLDRFLSKGYFKSKRNLQVAGIACLALATRIEENQPYNGVRKRTYCVGSDIYSRCEVVAMEWLVQEVLNFQCYMPTIYNFLWFYLKAAKANEEVERTASYLAVLALLGHEQLCFWPSTVAAGLVILAFLSTNQDVSCTRVVETHVRTKEDDLSGCLKSLEWLVKYAC